jgi:hypothetical protein
VTAPRTLGAEAVRPRRVPRPPVGREWPWAESARGRRTVPASRLLIVSNRLPVTMQVEDDRLALVASSGGLATGLGGIHDAGSGSWIGWAGVSAERLAGREAEAVASSKARARSACPSPRRRSPASTPVRQRRALAGATRPGGASGSRSGRLVGVPGRQRTLRRRDRARGAAGRSHLAARLPPAARAAAAARARPDLRIGFFLHTPFPTPPRWRRCRSARRCSTGCWART